MAKHAKITIDWLRKGLEVDDVLVLRRLVTDHMPWLEKGLDIQLFEQTYGLASLPKEHFPVKRFDSLGLDLVNSEITEWNPQIIPNGDRLREQVESVLPQSLDQEELESISYALSRILLDDMPLLVATDIPPQGLDTISSSLMGLFLMAKSVDQSVPWLLLIWRISIINLKLRKLREIRNAIREASDIDAVVDLLDQIKDEVQGIVASDDDPFIRKFSSWSSELKAFGEALEKEIEALDRRIRVAREEKDNVMLKTLREGRKERKRENEESLLKKLTDLTKWIEEEIRLHRERLAVIERKSLSIRPDALTDSSSQMLSRAIRKSMNILDYEMLGDVAKIAAEKDTLGAPSIEEIRKGLGVEHWRAKEISKRIRNLIDERFIASYRTIGLKLRYVLTPSVRRRLSSPGFLEDLVLGRTTYYSKTIGFDPRTVSVHVEPSGSNGPPSRKGIDDQLHIDVNSELVSFRLDLYDQQQHSWRIEPWVEEHRSYTENPSWFVKDSTLESNKASLTSRDVDILGPLIGLQSRTRERLWILKALGLPQRTISDSTIRLIDLDVLRPVHYPLLDFCGLPESIIMLTCGVDRKNLNSFAEWIMSVFPYVKIRYDYSKGNLVAEARTPLFGLTRTEEHLNHRAESLDGDVVIGRVAAVPHSYYLTVFQRLYSEKEKAWYDPWT